MKMKTRPSKDQKQCPTFTHVRAPAWWFDLHQREIDEERTYRLCCKYCHSLLMVFAVVVAAAVAVVKSVVPFTLSAHSKHNETPSCLGMDLNVAAMTVVVRCPTISSLCPTKRRTMPCRSDKRKLNNSNSKNYYHSHNKNPHQNNKCTR